MSDRNANGPVLALSGGVGGAKLALGLYRILPPDTLTVIANTGDDFAHLGLQISPDLDTLLYTLSGNDNPELGWGRRGETWTFMAALEALGGESLVPPRRRRSCDAYRAHAPSGRGRETVVDHRRFPPPSRHRRAPIADVRRSRAHPIAYERGLARFPGLFCAIALRTRDRPPRICRRRRCAGHLRMFSPRSPIRSCARS